MKPLIITDHYWGMNTFILLQLGWNTTYIAVVFFNFQIGLYWR